MSASQPTDWLPGDVVAQIVETVLNWDGYYPIRWSKEMAELVRDPAIFHTYIATHAMIHGPSPELAETLPPDPEPPGGR